MEYAVLAVEKGLLENKKVFMKPFNSLIIPKYKAHCT